MFQVHSAKNGSRSETNLSPPVLLSMAHWYGTLAAVRELGRRGIDVHVAQSTLAGQAGWSRFAGHRLRSPDERNVAKYLDWLLKLGRRSPGLALCATSDDLRFLYAEHDVELRQSFLLETPNLGVLREVLDKKRLHEQAARVGLSTPASVFPNNPSEAESLADGLRYPLLIKQRMQVLSRTLSKGTALRGRSEIAAAYASFCSNNTFDPAVLTRWPDAGHPFLQEYLPANSGQIYCLAGFIAPDGGGSACRAAMKVLSHPRHLGIGLLFEHADVIPHLETRLLQLCKNVGYAGSFQCEFIVAGGEHLLIDFNPRFYNYMAFDHARGLPQAYLSYLHAIGDHTKLHNALVAARTPPPEAANTIYCNRVGAWMQLRLERLFGRIPRADVAQWQIWRKRAARVVDPIWEDDDRVPGFADLLMRFREMALRPRGFLRGNTRRPF